MRSRNALFQEVPESVARERALFLVKRLGLVGLGSCEVRALNNR